MVTILLRQKNIPFDSTLTDANVAGGRSANGKIKWKTNNEKTIKDFE